MAKWFYRCINISAIGLVLIIASSFFGRIIPIGDSFTVFRLPIICLSVAVLLLCRSRRLRYILLGLVLWVVLSDSLIRYGYSEPKTGSYRIYQKNLSFRNQSQDKLIEDIIQSKADFVSFQEVSQNQKYLLEALIYDYPYHLWCPFASIGGVAILSRHPIKAKGEICQQGIALVKVKSEKEDLWIGSVHLHWPWPHQQAQQVNDIAPLLESLDAPIILGGDFNAVPWSSTVKTLERAMKGQRVGPLRSSYDLIPFFSITIDHVIAGNKNFKTQIRPKLGSDHRGLIADVDPSRAPHLRD